MRVSFSLVLYPAIDKCPVPERLQRFTPHIDYNLDGDHKPIGDDKPQFNNYFINVIKNFGGHFFMNCEAGTLYPHRARLEEAKITTCFNDYHDLIVAARIGKEGYITSFPDSKTSLRTVVRIYKDVLHQCMLGLTCRRLSIWKLSIVTEQHKVEHHDLPHNIQGPLSDCWNHLEFFSPLPWMHLLNVLDVLHVILDHCIHTQWLPWLLLGPEVEVDPCVWLCTLSSIDHQCLNTNDLDVEPGRMFFRLLS